MNKVQALHSFWSGFSLKAYDETSVPDSAQLPYLTYEVSTDDFGHILAQTASLWYRDSSWASITEKEQMIADYIGKGGKMISYDEGAIWIRKAAPWSQRMSDPSDEMIRRIVLNVIVEFLD